MKQISKNHSSWVSYPGQNQALQTRVRDWRLNAIMRAILLATVGSTALSASAAGSLHHVQDYMPHGFTEAEKKSRKYAPVVNEIRSTNHPFLGVVTLSAQSLSLAINPHANAPAYEDYLMLTSSSLTNSTVRVSVPAQATKTDPKKQLSMMTVGGYSSTGQAVQENFVLFEANGDTGYRAIAGLASSANLLPEKLIHLPYRGKVANEVTNIGPIRTQRNTLETDSNVTLGESLAGALSDYSFVGKHNPQGTSRDNHSIYKSMSRAKWVDFIDSSRLDSESIEALDNRLVIGESNHSHRNPSLLIGAQTSMFLIADDFDGEGEFQKSFVSASVKKFINERNSVQIGNDSKITGAAIGGLTRINLTAGDITTKNSRVTTERSASIRDVVVNNNSNTVTFADRSEVQSMAGKKNVKTELDSGLDNRSKDVVIGGAVDLHAESGNLTLTDVTNKRQDIDTDFSSLISLSHVGVDAKNNTVMTSGISKTKGSLTGGKISTRLVAGSINLRASNQSKGDKLPPEEELLNLKLVNTSFRANENAVILSRGSEHEGDVVGGSVTMSMSTKPVGLPLTVNQRPERHLKFDFRNFQMSASENEVNLYGKLQSGSVYGGKLSVLLEKYRDYQHKFMNSHHTGFALDLLATDNKVILEKGVSLGDGSVSLFGGYINDKSMREALGKRWTQNPDVKYDAFSGNTLEVQARSVHAQTVANFENYHFKIYPDHANKDVAQLNVKEIYFGNENPEIVSSNTGAKKSVVKVIGIHPGKVLRANDRFYLIKASEKMAGELLGAEDEADLIAHKDIEVKDVIVPKGISYYYSIKTEADRKKRTVIAKVVGTKQSDKLTDKESSELEMRDLRKKIKQLEQDGVKRNREQHLAHQRDLQKLRELHAQQMNEFKSEFEAIQNKAAEAGKEFREKSEQLDQANRDLASAVKEREGFRQELAKVRNEQNSERAKSMQEHEALKRREDELESQLRDKDHEIQEKGKEVENLQAQAKQFKDREALLLGSLNDKQKKLEQLESDNKHANELLHDKESSLALKDATIGNLTKTVELMNESHQAELTLLQSTLNAYAQEIETVTKSRENKDRDLAEAERKLANLTQERDAAIQQLADVKKEQQSERSKSAQEMAALNDKQKKLENKLQVQDKDIAEQGREISRLGNEAKGLKNRESQLLQNLEDERARIVKLESDNKHANDLLQDKDKQIAGLNQTVEKAGVQRANDAKQISDLKGKLEASQAEVVSVREEILEKNAQLDENSRQKQTLTQERDAARQQLADVKQELGSDRVKSAQEIADLKHRQAELESEILAKDQALGEKDNKIEGLQADVTGLQNRESQLLQNLEDERARIVKLESDNKLANDLVNDQAHDLELQRQTIRGLNQYVAQLRDNHAKEIKRLGEVIDSGKAQASKASQEIASKNAQLEEANRNQAAMTQDRDALEQRLAAVNAELAAEKASSAEEKAALRRNQADLEAQLQAKNHRIAEQDGFIGRLQAGLTNLQNEHAALQEQIAHQQELLVVMQRQLGELDAEVLALQQKNDELEALNRDLERMLADAENQLLAQADGDDAAIVNPQLRALSEGQLSGLMLITRAADVVSDWLYQTIQQQNPRMGLNLFVTTSAAANHYGHSAHIRSQDMLLTAGVSLRQPGATGAVFVEGGWSDFDTHNDFAKHPKVDGKGHNSFIGFGVYGRLENESRLGPYIESSFRLGRVNTQFKTEDLKDPLSGAAASYSLQRPYFSAHAGLGYVLPLTPTSQLDLSTQYLWSKVNGQDVKVAEDPIQFNSVESQRLRAGVTLNQQYGKDLTLRFGVGYEYEFDSQARATTHYAHAIDAPSVRGGTALLKLGATYQPEDNPNVSVRFDLSAYTGQRTGARADLQLMYRF